MIKFYKIKTPKFSCSILWIDKEGRGPKNWCFWTVVLEETLESPLDSKEIKPVNLKGNQPWILIGRTDAEVEAPILWPPHAKSRLTGKDPYAGKDWRHNQKRVTEDEMAGWYHQCNGHELGQILGYGDREAWYAAVHGVAVGYDLATKSYPTLSQILWPLIWDHFSVCLLWSKYVVYVMSSCWYTVSVCVLAAQSCLTLCDPMDYSQLGSSIQCCQYICFKDLQSNVWELLFLTHFNHLLTFCRMASRVSKCVTETMIICLLINVTDLKALFPHLT